MKPPDLKGFLVRVLAGETLIGAGFLATRTRFATCAHVALFCLDEADRVFAYLVKTAFFASVRAFYNRGAFDPIWKRVNWMLSSSTEPAFFIEDIAQSPFNIGVSVRLAPFDKNQVAEFAWRFGMTFSDSDTENIIDYVGGQPYLLHLLVYNMATRRPPTVF